MCYTSVCFYCLSSRHGRERWLNLVRGQFQGRSEIFQINSRWSKISVTSLKLIGVVLLSVFADLAISFLSHEYLSSHSSKKRVRRESDALLRVAQGLILILDLVLILRIARDCGDVYLVFDHFHHLILCVKGKFFDSVLSITPICTYTHFQSVRLERLEDGTERLEVKYRYNHSLGRSTATATQLCRRSRRIMVRKPNHLYLSPVVSHSHSSESGSQCDSSDGGSGASSSASSESDSSWMGFHSSDSSMERGRLQRQREQDLLVNFERYFPLKTAFPLRRKVQLIVDINSFWTHFLDTRMVRKDQFPSQRDLCRNQLKVLARFDHFRPHKKYGSCVSLSESVTSSAARNQERRPRSLSLISSALTTSTLGRRSSTSKPGSLLMYNEHPTESDDFGDYGEVTQSRNERTKFLF